MSEVREVHHVFDDDDAVVDQGSGGSGYSERRVVRRPAWSPTQFVNLVIGVLFIVFGGVALARSGLHFTAVPFTKTQVAGLGFTSMSAAITIVAGVIVACSCAAPGAARTVGWISGVVFIAFGLVVALAPTAFTNMWGFTAANGVVIVICGVVLTLAAAIFPVLQGASTYSRASSHPVTR